LRLEQKSRSRTDSDSDSSSSSDSSDSSSDTLVIAPSRSLSRESTPPTTAVRSEFRLLEKNFKLMDVDVENGHVKSVRIEVLAA